MTYVTTLISPHQYPSIIDDPILHIQNHGITIQDITEREPTIALDIVTNEAIPKTVMDDIRAQFQIDLICQPLQNRSKRLFFADMDATMVVEETLDELADHAGLKDKIAAITTQAMNGELDFHDAIRARVGLLKGLPETALKETVDKITYNPGAENLLKNLKEKNLYCVLVSGGFTYFTNRVASELGFDENHGNILNIENAALTGTVTDPISDKSFKQEQLQRTAQKLSLSLDQTIAIGDGANDLPMLQTAGLGIGWRSKPVLRNALDNHLLYCGLDALTYVLGFNPRAA